MLFRHWYIFIGYSLHVVIKVTQRVSQQSKQTITSINSFWFLTYVLIHPYFKNLKFKFHSACAKRGLFCLRILKTAMLSSKGVNSLCVAWKIFVNHKFSLKCKEIQCMYFRSQREIYEIFWSLNVKGSENYIFWLACPWEL